MVKKKKKLVPTELGRKVTDFLEENFAKLMDYKFTAKMETQLDDVADGTLDKNSIIKPFYDYIQEQMGKIVPVVFANSSNGFKPPEQIGTYGKIPIIMNNGKFGKYISCDIYKFNAAALFDNANKKTNNTNDNNLDDLEADLAAGVEADSVENSENSDDESDSNSNKASKSITQFNLDTIDTDTIVAKVIEKIEKLKNTSSKEWKIGKKRYILKNGTYGYYIEEYSTITKKKTANYSIKYLIAKIEKNNQVGVEDAIDLITEEDIKETIEYFVNSKSKFKKSYVKK